MFAACQTQAISGAGTFANLSIGGVTHAIISSLQEGQGAMQLSIQLSAMSAMFSQQV